MTNNSPLISIIIPVFNVEQVLKRCLNSVLSQSYNNWECICIDDGSPDNSGTILDEYAALDNRFHVVHKENGGVSSARNHGIEKAKGEWICFVDSDDQITPDHLSSMIWSNANKDINEIDMICCGVKSDGGSVFNPGEHIYRQNQIGKELPTLLKENITLYSVWCKLIRRSIIEENHIRFDHQIRLSEDTIFSYSCLAHCRSIEMVEACTYIYTGEWSNTKYHLSWDELAYMHKQLISARRSLRSAFPGEEEMIRNVPPRFDRIDNLMEKHSLSECYQLWAEALMEEERDITYFLQNIMLPEDWVIPQLYNSDKIEKNDLVTLNHFLDVEHGKIIMPTAFWSFIMKLLWDKHFTLLRIMIRMKKIIDKR